ncbi:MAG TPA: glycosyl hydrolase [Gemmatimonadales bacterium]|nr:glycosyl hydrolase [Gemmatimonadales bacterium]
MRGILLGVGLCLTPVSLAAQSVSLDTSHYDALRWRLIGPFRGGRSTAVAGHADQPLTYYLGTTGGGVFKTTDGGLTWAPVTDSTRMAGSIGAIAVAPSDPNVVYVGTGESPPRGNVSPGNGVYRSTDGGRSWRAAGLAEAGQIGAIMVHPDDPDHVYVAALGHIFGPNDQRGVYRSTDGGATWRRVLFRDANTGAVDLVMDPANPRVLYAALWQARRYPWTFESGGPGSGLFKSTDGGDTWTELTRNEGLPDSGVVGKIGVAVSPARPDRVWAIVEHEEGGVFRSDDGGRTWQRLNDERRLRQRAWYYTHIHADPKDAETVYVLNTGFYRSVDGGRTYTTIAVPHGDNHALWIAPNDPMRMINGNDGGANVSVNGGASWTRQDNQPTAQMYHAHVTSHFPYYVCGGQQDNSTICVPSRTTGGSIPTSSYYVVGGCESGFVATRPDQPDVSFAGCYGGQLDRHDRRTGQERSVAVWPDNPMGWGAADLKHRFQWTYPIYVSPHDPDVLYVTSQFVHRSTNEGQSWETISPDLTRNDKTRQGASGGPITRDNTSVEYYGTVFTLALSPRDANVLWAGSDDGRVHVTRDAGASWTDVTPRDLPEWALISMIDASPHDPGTAYLAATRYKLDDFAPYIYRTADYGRTWRRLVNGIPAGHFIRVVRQDPERANLLYAGGEFGAYVSFDDGAHWQSLQLNLPPTPIHDLVVKETDLVAATHGRSFWILDDVTPLRQLTAQVAQKPRHLFTPRTTLRMGGGGGGGDQGEGQNPPAGVVVHYYFRAAPSEEVKLEVLDAAGAVIRTYSSKARERAERLPADSGMNRFVWNLRYPDASRFDGMILWAGGTQGPRAVPGRYRIRLTAGSWSETAEFELVNDPRVQVSQADLQAQFDFLMKIRNRLTEANDAVSRIRAVRRDVDGVLGRMDAAGDRGRGPAADSVRALARAIKDELTGAEEAIYQTKNRSNQDPLNYPIRLNNKIAALAGVAGGADARPTDQALAVFEELSAALQRELDRVAAVVRDRIPAFNQAVGRLELPAVVAQ